ncbi:flp pilus-assembly TadE/G-like family protein [Bifidobacterium eulemuris]|nr:flp pilus-assembly TadE/G-like family protein [Bifidobacterium eulemuris]
MRRFLTRCFPTRCFPTRRSASVKQVSSPNGSILAADEGSGTMAGVMLIMVAGLMLAVAAAAGNLLVCQTQARAIADLAAIQAAVAWRQGRTDDPCALAADVAAVNDGDIGRCVVDGDDVELSVVVATMVPVAPQVERASRAGPVECREL